MSVSGPSARILHADTADLGALIRRHAADTSAALGHERSRAPARARAGRLTLRRIPADASA